MVNQLPNLPHRLPRQPLRILLFCNLMLNPNFLFLLFLLVFSPISEFGALPSVTQIRTPLHTPLPTPASRRTSVLPLTARRTGKASDRRRTRLARAARRCRRIICRTHACSLRHASDEVPNGANAEIEHGVCVDLEACEAVHFLWEDEKDVRERGVGGAGCVS